MMGGGCCCAPVREGVTAAGGHDIRLLPQARGMGWGGVGGALRRRDEDPPLH